MTQLMRRVPEGATRLPRSWQPIESLRREMDRLFEDFGFGFTQMPRRRALFGLEPLEEGEVRWGMVPPIDLVEKDQAYEITAELCRYGSFQRSFPMLESIDADKIEATFKNGVLTIMLPKKPEAQRREKHIHLKAA